MVTLYSGKVELGTGVLTAITQIAAEELSVPFGRVTTIQGDTALTPNQGPTYASLSIQDGGVQIRRAAATAREALLDQAARKLGVAKAELVVRDGVVSLRDGSKSVSYAELVGDRQAHAQGESGGAAEGPEGLHDRRQAGAATRHSGQDLRDLRLRAGREGAGHAARARGSSGGRRASTLAKLRRHRLPQDQGLRARRAQGRLPGGGRDQRMGRHQRIDCDRRQVVGLGRTARRVAALRVRAQLEGRPQRSVPEHGQYGRSAEGAAAGRCRRRTTLR